MPIGFRQKVCEDAANALRIKRAHAPDADYLVVPPRRNDTAGIDEDAPAPLTLMADFSLRNGPAGARQAKAPA
jgi:hypothetical protein